MEASLGIFAPLARYGKLQRAYMHSGDESVLEEAGDIGRLLAVTRLPLESVLEIHSSVLADEIARGEMAPAELIAAAVTCLAQVMVAWRMAAEGVGTLYEASGLCTDAVPPLFLRFQPGGTLLPVGDGRFADTPSWARAADLDELISLLSGTCRIADVKEAIRQRRLISFEVTLPIGGQRHLMAVICSFRDASGIVAIHDVTGRHLIRNADFQRRKLESLGQLAGGIAHEINNLLQPIVSTAQIALDDYNDHTDVCADFQVVLDCARSAAELMRAVLAFARRAPLVLVPLPLAVTVRDELAILRLRLPHSVRLIANLDPCGDALIIGNAGEMGQILRDMVGNAIDASAPEGTITVSAAEFQVAGVDAVRLMVPMGRYLRLTVSDDGSGVPPAIVPRIFDPFFTTKDIGKGTGRGLSIVRSIVQSWGGSIVLREGCPKGACFDIYLAPAPDGHAADKARPQLESRHP